MNASRPTEIVNSSRQFDLHELFFSTTDPRGVILHGNEVFTRISGYVADDLIGSAHSVVRHPDMPRCVFKLFWDTIRAGQTIAAYVKNLAADGKYYWVLAIASPCSGGYLSVRLKPTSPLFDEAQRLYARLLQVEQENSTVGNKDRAKVIEAGTAELMSSLQQMGFADYESFMIQALTTEVETRDRSLKTKPAQRTLKTQRSYKSDRIDELINALEQCRYLERELQSAFMQTIDFRQVNQSIMLQSDQVSTVAAVIGTLSMNAKISAYHGNNSGTLQEIAKALGSVSVEVQTITRSFLAQAKSTATVLERLAFDIAVAKLQIEITRQFLGEIIEGQQGELDSRTRRSLTVVLSEVRSRTTDVFRSLEAASTSLTMLQTEVERLARNNKRLSFVQFAGQKEAVVYDNADSFAVVFKEVREQIASSLTSCDSLFESVRLVRHRTRSILMRKDNMLRQLADLEQHILHLENELVA